MACLVEVGEHLLTALQPPVDEEDDGHMIVAQFGALDHRLLDRSASMLTVVDEQARVHGQFEGADALSPAPVAEGREAYRRVHRSRQCGHDIAVAVLDEVAGNLGDAMAVEGALRAKLRRHLVVVEDEELGQEAHRAHGHVEFRPGLGTS